MDMWNVFDPSNMTMYHCDTRVTRWNETLRWHVQESYDKDLLIVQELKRKLNISHHWVPEDEEWQRAG